VRLLTTLLIAATLAAAQSTLDTARAARDSGDAATLRARIAEAQKSASLDALLRTALRRRTRERRLFEPIEPSAEHSTAADSPLDELLLRERQDALRGVCDIEMDRENPRFLPASAIPSFPCEYASTWQRGRSDTSGS
jgi:hypothetical protein